MTAIPTVKVSREDFEAALKLFRGKGVVTVPHLIKELGVDSAKASKLYGLLRDYCLAEGACMEHKRTLYLLTADSPEVRELRSALLKRSGRLEYIVYSLVKSHEGECVELSEVIDTVARMFKTPTPYVLEAIYRLWSKGLVIERRRTCFKAVGEL